MIKKVRPARLGVNLIERRGAGIVIDILFVSTDGKALVKLVDPAQLLKSREEKKALADAKAAKKAAQVEAERQKRLAKLEKGRVPPSEMFKPPNVPEGTYRSWDEMGIPLTDGEGKSLSKNAVKKVQKEHASQTKAHQEFLEWQTTQTALE